MEVSRRLSIIIPVYDVEKYIRPCLESVLAQHLGEDAEVILVNDGTRDNSFARIADIIETHGNIVVVEQENQGLSAARNTGLGVATGDYVLFLDSDDLLIADTVPLLLEQAVATQADMTVGDFVKLTDAQIADYKPESAARGEVLVTNGRSYFVDTLNPKECYVWRTIYRRAFLDAHQLRFITGIYFEDVPFTTECCLKAEKCVRVPLLFYIYRQRSNSIVSSVNMKKVTDFNIVLQRLQTMKQEYTLPTDVELKLSDTMFSTFSLAIWYLTHDKALLGRRKEYVDDLKQKVPSMKFAHGIKQRVVSLLYGLMPSTYIKLRSL